MGRNIFRRKKPVEVGPQTLRVRVVAIFVAMAFAAILVRAWYVQVESNELYIAKSKNQHESTFTMNARRGNSMIPMEENLLLPWCQHCDSQCHRKC